MNASTTYVLSVILALGFHAAVVSLLLMNWENEEKIQTPSIKPYYIEATIVDENPYRAKKEREQAKNTATRKRQVAKRQADEKAARLNNEAIARAKKLALDKQLEAQRKEEEKKADLKAAQALQDSTRQDQAVVEKERLKMEQGLALSILEEQDFRRAVTDDEKAMAYVSQIQRDIIQNWSRPPSARNGMEALLRVFLVPTGEVVNVVLEDSSGNDAFDRSALLAVRKAERFQVPPDSRQFERNFREFTVLFRPEDLRL